MQCWSHSLLLFETGHNAIMDYLHCILVDPQAQVASVEREIYISIFLGITYCLQMYKLYISLDSFFDSYPNTCLY